MAFGSLPGQGGDAWVRGVPDQGHRPVAPPVRLGTIDDVTARESRLLGIAASTAVRYIAAAHPERTAGLPR
jgi:hypothetical protein